MVRLRLTSRTSGLLALALTTLAVTGCDSHAPVGGVPAAPTYSAAVRSLASCAATVRVPAALSAVTPSTAAGPTSVLRVGDAVELAGVTSARVGLTGVRGTNEQDVVCRTRRGGRTVLVARAPGYVRVGVVAAGGDRPALVFVKVTA